MSDVLPSHVRILVVDRLQRILLAKRQDPASGYCIWEPPGGAVEAGESLVEAAERELLEETGIQVSIPPQRWTPFHREYTWKNEHRVRNEAFCTVNVDAPTVQQQMPTEEERATFLEWQWVSTERLRELDADHYPPDPFAMTVEIPNAPHTAAANRPLGSLDPC